MSSARRMPDGSLCWSGPTCKRHNVAAIKASKKELAALKVGAMFSPVKKRELANRNDSFLQEIEKRQRKAYVQVYENLSHKIPDKIEDEQLPNMRSVRRGLNKDDDVRKTILDYEGLALRCELTQDDKDSISYYTGSSYQYMNAYLRDGRDGLRNVTYLKGWETSVVPESTVEKYVEMAEENIKTTDALFDNNSRLFNHKRVLYRSVRFPEKQRNGQSLQEYVAETYPVGKVVESKAYESTSADSDLMLAYQSDSHKRNDEVVFEILTNKGVILHDPTSYGTHISHSEREVLLPRGMKYRVVNVGTVTYETTYASGRPEATVFKSMRQSIPKKARKLVVQLEEITD